MLSGVESFSLSYHPPIVMAAVIDDV